MAKANIIAVRHGSLYDIETVRPNTKVTLTLFGSDMSPHTFEAAWLTSADRCEVSWKFLCLVTRLHRIFSINDKSDYCLSYLSVSAELYCILRNIEPEIFKNPPAKGIRLRGIWDEVWRRWVVPNFRTHLYRRKRFIIWRQWMTFCTTICCNFSSIMAYRRVPKSSIVCAQNRRIIWHRNWKEYHFSFIHQ